MIAESSFVRMNGDAEGIPIQGRLPLELQQIKEEQDAAKAKTIKNMFQGENLGRLKHIVKATGVKLKEASERFGDPAFLDSLVVTDR